MSLKSNYISLISPEDHADGTQHTSESSADQNSAETTDAAGSSSDSSGEIGLPVGDPLPAIDPPLIDPPEIDPPMIDPPLIDPPIIDPPERTNPPNIIDLTYSDESSTSKQAEASMPGTKSLDLVEFDTTLATEQAVLASEQSTQVTPHSGSPTQMTDYSTSSFHESSSSAALEAQKTTDRMSEEDYWHSNTEQQASGTKYVDAMEDTHDGMASEITHCHL